MPTFQLRGIIGHSQTNGPFFRSTWMEKQINVEALYFGNLRVGICRSVEDRATVP